MGDQPCGHNLQGFCDDSWRGRYTTVQLRVAVDASTTLKARNSSSVQPWQSPSISLQLFVELYAQHAGRKVSYCNLREHALNTTRYQAPLHRFHFISFAKHGMHLPVNWTLTWNNLSNIQFVVHVQMLLSVTVPWLAIGRISYLHLSITSFLIHSLSEVVITKRGRTTIHPKQDNFYCSTQVSLYINYLLNKLSNQSIYRYM